MSQNHTSNSSSDDESCSIFAGPLGSDYNYTCYPEFVFETQLLTRKQDQVKYDALFHFGRQLYHSDAKFRPNFSSVHFLVRITMLLLDSTAHLSELQITSLQQQFGVLFPEQHIKAVQGSKAANSRRARSEAFFIAWRSPTRVTNRSGTDWWNWPSYRSHIIQFSIFVLENRSKTCPNSTSRRKCSHSRQLSQTSVTTSASVRAHRTQHARLHSWVWRCSRCRQSIFCRWLRVNIKS